MRSDLTLRVANMGNKLFSIESAKVNRDGMTIDVEFSLSPYPEEQSGPEWGDRKCLVNGIEAKLICVMTYTKEWAALSSEEQFEVIQGKKNITPSGIWWRLLCELPDGSQIPNGISVQVSASEGLLRDRFGNRTPEFTNYPAVNNSFFDSNGLLIRSLFELEFNGR